MAEGIAGKVILVTGGCGDIGRATAAALAAEGATVVASDLYAPEEARERLGGWGGTGRISDYVRADVRVRSDVDAALTTIVDRFGRLDVAISKCRRGQGHPIP